MLVSPPLFRIMFEWIVTLVFRALLEFPLIGLLR